MDPQNVTRITTIYLLGFQIPPNCKFLVFFLFIVLYCMTICGNLLIITLVVYSKTLHSPMYFFLSQLAGSDILLATNIVPNMISTVLVEKTAMSFSDCLAQFYFFCLAEGLECLLLTAMSWDRYLAICRPLHYLLKMNYQVCWTLVIVSWVLGFFAISVYNFTLSDLRFCGPNIIDHFFCDFDPLIRLSCSDTSTAQLEVMIFGTIFAVFPFLIIIISYTYIIITILKISSITGRQKVFSTCSSHLMVVSIYYGTLSCVYVVPSKGQTTIITKLVSLLYTAVTPMLNPVIYSLRNKELKDAAGKLINITRTSPALLLTCTLQ